MSVCGRPLRLSPLVALLDLLHETAGGRVLSLSLTGAGGRERECTGSSFALPERVIALLTDVASRTGGNCNVQDEEIRL